MTSSDSPRISDHPPRKHATGATQSLHPSAAVGPGPFVTVERVSKNYGRTTAVDGLDLEIAPGETLGLLGANGAGKTTLMHLLAGVVRPDSGVVRVGALDPVARATRRAIGLAPQLLAIYPRLTAAENLRFFGRIFGLQGAELEARVRWALELSDLLDRADDRAGHFSGGMQRRLNLACAVVHKPALLLLDEPTAGVDAQSRNHLFESIDQLKALTGVTVVYSTHQTEEAVRLCDRVAVVDRGRVMAVGSPSTLLEEHAFEDLQALLLSLTGKEPRD
ncbi:MAG: ABC transporter ATP-binding protein [Polyangiaceae bacterium]